LMIQQLEGTDLSEINKTFIHVIRFSQQLRIFKNIAEEITFHNLVLHIFFESDVVIVTTITSDVTFGPSALELIIFILI